MTVYVDQGSVAINSEQIDMFDYAMEGTCFGDDLGGDYLPGVTAVGGIWVGIKRADYNEVTKIQIRINSPHDEDLNHPGPDYNLVIDVTGWGYEPLPDELR